MFVASHASLDGSYRPPSFIGWDVPFRPPQTIMSIPDHTAEWFRLASGAPSVDIEVQTAGANDVVSVYDPVSGVILAVFATMM